MKAANSMPTFAIVGHPNKGKSSLVATLAQNDQVQISPVSGTTIDVQTFPMEVDGQLCYQLVDTPGFQRPRALLELLNQRSQHAADRSDTLRQCLADPTFVKQFPDEVQLLKPVMDGAAIIYVVDGGKPYRPEYEAEMEILRWTGQPRMAVINPIGSDRYVKEWQRALDQFFTQVRVFNPMQSDFTARQELLSSFASLHSEWLEPMQQAVDALAQDQQQRVKQAITQLISFCDQALSYKDTFNVPGETVPENIQLAKTHAFQLHLRVLEKRSRVKIENIFRHHQLQRSEPELQFDQADLFHQPDWTVWGLKKRQVLMLAAGGGAASGVLVDIGVGGSSLMTGAIVGGAIATGAAWIWGKDFARIKVGKLLPVGGREVTIGPVNNPMFSWALFGRALYHLEQVLRRNHALRDKLNLSDQFEKFQLAKYLQRLSKKDQFLLSAWLLSIGQKKFTRPDTQRIVKIITRMLETDSSVTRKV